MPNTKRKPLRGRPPREPEAPLRAIMESLGIDSIRLAELAGCHRCHITKLLAGRHTPRRALALRLANILHVDPRDIWWPDADPKG